MQTVARLNRFVDWFEFSFCPSTLSTFGMLPTHQKYDDLFLFDMFLIFNSVIFVSLKHIHKNLCQMADILNTSSRKYILADVIKSHNLTRNLGSVT